MPEVTDIAARRRYEMVVDGVTAYVTYVRHGDRLTLVHTEVPKAGWTRRRFGVGDSRSRRRPQTGTAYCS
jgi:hypothetical protein